MLLARNLNKSINNAVESSFQSLLDLGGAVDALWGSIDKESEQLEPIIIWDRKLGSWDGSIVRKTEKNVIQRKNLRNASSSGTGNLALETVPWWERQTKMWFKEKNWETQCLYCVQWANGYGMRAGEHGWARRWTVKLVRDTGRVLNGAPQFVGRPEGELQCQVRPSRTSGFSACQILWLIALICFSRGSLLRCFLHVRDRGSGFSHRNNNRSPIFSTGQEGRVGASSSTMAASKIAVFWNHPAGPKTIHFWAPTFKWGISIANVADFSKPPDKISYPQQIAVTATGLIWSRYSTVITPKNWNLFSVNVAMAATGLYQLSRKISQDYLSVPEAPLNKVWMEITRLAYTMCMLLFLVPKVSHKLQKKKSLVLDILGYAYVNVTMNNKILSLYFGMVKTINFSLILQVDV
jgi:hypothetical protein